MQPKLIAGAIRLSRGSWCIGAFVDPDGLLCSQQFFALRPIIPLKLDELVAFCAVVNGPVANAFAAISSPKRGFRASVVGDIPIPTLLPGKLAELAGRYLELLHAPPMSGDIAEQPAHLLAQIDAAVLAAYDLPFRLERQLLAFFENAERPVAHPWAHWDVGYPAPGLNLAERLSGRFNPAGGWVEEVFQPLPADQIAAFRDYVG
jgi:hypothetical protein